MQTAQKLRNMEDNIKEGNYKKEDLKTSIEVLDDTSAGSQNEKEIFEFWENRKKDACIWCIICGMSNLGY